MLGENQNVITRRVVQAGSPSTVAPAPESTCVREQVEGVRKRLELLGDRTEALRTRLSDVLYPVPQADHSGDAGSAPQPTGCHLAWVVRSQAEVVEAILAIVEDMHSRLHL